MFPESEETVQNSAVLAQAVAQYADSSKSDGVAKTGEYAQLGRSSGEEACDRVLIGALPVTYSKTKAFHRLKIHGNL